jgi:hypothetical protein
VLYARYYAGSPQIDFQGLRTNEGLSKLITSMARELEKSTQSFVDPEHCLFLYTAFSVDSKKIPELRSRLKDAVFSILDEFQKDAGDKVERVIVNPGLDEICEAQSPTNGRITDLELLI